MWTSAPAGGFFTDRKVMAVIFKGKLFGHPRIVKRATSEREHEALYSGRE
jgi:hypothetical protein